MKKILYFALLFVFGLSTVYGEDCDDADMAVIKNQAKDVKVSVEKVSNVTDENGNFISSGYKLNVEGLPDGMHVEISNGEVDIIADNLNGKLSFYEVSPEYDTDVSKIYDNYYIMSSDAKVANVYADRCRKVAKEVELKIPKYNPYSEREECKGVDVSKFKACDPYYENEVTDNIFNYQLKEYKKSIESDKKNENASNDNSNNKEKKDNKREGLVDYLKSNYLSLIIIAFVFILIVVIINKRKNKRGVM